MVVVAAIDGQAGGTQTYTIAVVTADRPPTITSKAVQVVTAGLTYRYDVQASDPDGDPITYSLEPGAPAGMTVDSLGRITWATGIADVGIHRVAVSVDDDRGLFITQTFDLAVVADGKAPRID